MAQDEQRQLLVTEEGRAIGVVSDLGLLPYEATYRPALRFPDPDALSAVSHTALDVAEQPSVRCCLGDRLAPVLWRLAEAVDDFAYVTTAAGVPAGFITEPAAVAFAAEHLAETQTVKRFRTRRLVARPPTVSRDSGREALIESGVRHLLLLDRGSLVGVLSVRDLSGSAPVGGAASPTLAALVCMRPISIAPDLPVRVAAVMMCDLGIGCLPIVEDGSVVGVVTRTDILRAFADALGAGSG
jgi:CBS domain-containing protein